MLFVTENNEKFKLLKSIDDQLKYIADLRLNKPDEAKEIFDKGDQLILCASRGEFRKLRQLVDSYQEGEILTFFVSRMLIESLVNGYLMISSYILDNGYPFMRTDLPSVLHSSLELVDDARGVDIVEFLVAKKADINRQVSGSWITPLHISVRRLLLQTTLTLLNAGADVNAIAKDDLMPLKIAQDLEPSTKRDELIQLLVERGARDNWRRNTVPTLPQSVGVPKMETKYVSFAGGSAVLTPVSLTAPNAGFVSMKGMMFSTNTADQANGYQEEPVSIQPSHGESRQRKPRRQLQAVSSEVLSIDHSISDSSSPTIEKSSDGGLMFSTG